MDIVYVHGKADGAAPCAVRQGTGQFLCAHNCLLVMPRHVGGHLLDGVANLLHQHVVQNVEARRLNGSHGLVIQSSKAEAQQSASEKRQCAGPHVTKTYRRQVLPIIHVVMRQKRHGGRSIGHLTAGPADCAVPRDTNPKRRQRAGKERSAGLPRADAYSTATWTIDARWRAPAWGLVGAVCWVQMRAAVRQHN